MMMTAHPSTVTQKRDLHIGGVGSSRPVALGAIHEPMLEGTDEILKRAREALRSADQFLRDNPWPALGAVAVLGLAAGFILGRRL